MQRATTFDRLVSGLSGSERIEMLKRIESSYNSDDDPLFSNTDEDEVENLEILLNRLTIFQRIILFLKSLFQQRDIMEVLEESVLQRYATELERSKAGLFNAKSMMLGNGFALELKSLRDSFSCFVNPLSRALGPDKKDFIAYLAGFEFPLHQERLLEVTNPEIYAKEGTFLTSFDIRKKIDVERKEALANISESDRSKMYRHMRSLHFLSKLVFFPYSNVLSVFAPGPAGETASLNALRAQLLEFGDILSSQERAPSETALKALFLFDSQLDDKQNHGAIEETVRDSLEQAANGIGRIKLFCKTIPVLKLLKICAQNIGYVPERLGGGEDWYALYRKFWENRVDATMEEYTFRTSQQTLSREACKLLDMDVLPSLPHYTSSVFEEELSVRYEMTMAFLFHFIERLFLIEMNNVLKIFIVDGDFYKSANRQEFTNSYEGLVNTFEIIKQFDGDLSPTGEMGRELELARGELTQLSARYKKIRGIIGSADLDADKIINSCRDHLLLLVSIVKGILFGESGGRYDTLSNISYIGGSDNSSLINRLNITLKQIEEAQRILNELYDLEQSVKGGA